MRRILCLVVAFLAFGSVSTAAAQSAAILQPSDFALLGYYDVQTFGSDTAYMRGLTHRYVNGQLRFLSMTHTGTLQEFVMPSAFGQRVTTTTNSWNLGAVTGDFVGIWWDASTQRLWVTASIDYGNSDTYYPTRISTLSLGANGAVTNVKTVSLQGVTSKRIYGGVQAVPSWAQAELGCGPYVVGFGGYTSLAQQTSRAAMGPSLICIPDIANYSNGAEIPASAFKVLLDTPTDQRGFRKTIPLNYFDGGDADANGVRRENPQTPPTTAPYAGASWLSPNAQGVGSFVWGDSYYNNWAWIDTPTARGLVAVAALCGVTGQQPNAGKCWYQTSTLHFDGRTQEVHVWNPSSLDDGIMTRPTSMAELNLPRGITGSWDGDVPMANISGATFDGTTNTLYLVGYPLGVPSSGPAGQWDTGRLYAVKVEAGSIVPPPADTTGPTVSVTAPIVSTTVSGAVSLAANAADNVGVSSVWFTINGTTTGAEDATSPYQGTWNVGTSPSGSYAVRAVARDAAGNTTTSASIMVTVNNGSGDTVAPSVSVTAPIAGSTASGVISLAATASDNVGVSRVSFTVDGVTVGAADTTAPYQGSWNSTGAAVGSHTIRAIAVDAAGNTTTSAPVGVTVNSVPVDDVIAPMVSLTAPGAGSTVAGTVSLAAVASDNVGVSSVSFTVDGLTVGVADTTAPYQGTWNATGATSGTHAVRAVARDAAGNTTTSAATSVTVAVVTPPPSLQAPNVSMQIVTHVPLQCSMTLTTSQPDVNGGWSVRYSRNGTSIGSKLTSAPYKLVVNVGGGSYTFGATWTRTDSTGHLVTLRAPTTVTSCSF
ncbi:MAG: Ig-like domain-containing protein [Acidobacteriota bacterium]